MPRKAAGARLYFRKDQNVWIIRDTGYPDKSTGSSDRRSAERALAAYIASKGVITGTRHPDKFKVREALNIYGRERGVTRADPVRIAYAIEALLPFWGDLPISSVKGETCRRYAKSRVRRFKDGTTRPLKDGSIRRELSVLQAAINYCHKEGYVTSTTVVTLPEPPPPRDRWLTRSEAAKLIWTAWRSPRSKHLARFILIALYTGTRKDAILRLGYMPNTVGGWIDLEQEVIYRRSSTERETKKRRKPIRMPRKLLSHCRRWKANGAQWAVEIRGARVGDIKTAFDKVSARAGLSEISPHTLKHTAITWAMAKGMRIEQAADYFDTTAETIRRVYWHHSPDYQNEAAAIIDRKM